VVVAAAAPDSAVAVASKHSPAGGGEVDGGAADARADAAPLGQSPADAATDGADLAPSVPDLAAPDLQPDLAPVLPPDAAPDLAPDRAPDPAPDLSPPSACPAGAGPAMVKADLASKPFCIDSTEVSSAQYADFLAATGNGTQTGGQPAACGWNTSYLPESDGGFVWPYPAGQGDRPVVDVDWCDARAYCKWAGKRLCGKIGGGSLVGVAAGASPSGSQWEHACSRNGQHAYPYGSSFDSHACNIAAPSEQARYIADVGSRRSCQGGYAGVFDLSGNVEEWIDACDKNTGASDLCASAGASAYLGGLTPSEITCPDSVYGVARNTRYVMLGFRCCADLP